MALHHYKLIVLILDNEDATYSVHQAMWKAYMNSDPDILCLFLRSDPEKEWLDMSTNTLYCRGTESLIPGVLEKTLKGFAYVLNHYNCDHVLRTNISSFYVFPRLKTNVLPTLPRFGCYAGVQGFDGVPFASGAGFLLSPDVAQLLVRNSNKLPFQKLDDLAIGSFLHTLAFPIIPLRRFDFVEECNTDTDSLRLAHADAQNTYHFRIKNAYDRARVDPHYMRLLLRTYYGIELLM